MVDDSLEALIDAMLDQIPDDSGSEIVIKVKSESMPSPSTATASKGHGQPEYDPALVYILEFCTVLALRDRASVELVGERVVGTIQAVLRDVSHYHSTVIGRATFYLFNLLRASYVSAPCRASIWDRGQLLTTYVCTGS